MSKPRLTRWVGISKGTKFDAKYFLDEDLGPYNTTQDTLKACHTCALGSITVVDRMTGFEGFFRDVETGFRDLHGEFWLASGNFNILEQGCETFGEAIALIKQNANTCVGEEHDEQYPLQRAEKAEARVKELEAGFRLLARRANTSLHHTDDVMEYYIELAKKEGNDE